MFRSRPRLCSAAAVGFDSTKKSIAWLIRVILWRFRCGETFESTNRTVCCKTRTCIRSEVRTTAPSKFGVMRLSIWSCLYRAAPFKVSDSRTRLWTVHITVRHKLGSRARYCCPKFSEIGHCQGSAAEGGTTGELGVFRGVL